MFINKPSHKQHYKAKNGHRDLNLMSNEAFDQLYWQCKKDFMHLNKNKGRKEDFEDAFHDAFLALLNNSATQESFESAQHQRSFMLGIARNKWLMIRRKMQRLLLSEDMNDSLYNTYENSENQHQYLDVLLRSLNHLKQNTREILERFYFLGQDHRTIASQMNLKDDNVAAVTLSRARTKLKATVVKNLD